MTQTNKRELPEGWRWHTLNEIGTIEDGDWILNADYSASGVRLLQVGDVGISRFVGKSARFVSIERARELGCTFLKPGDILISRMPDPMGRACILPDLGYPCITAVDVSIFRINDAAIDPLFLIQYLNSPDWFAKVTSLASGATRQRISRSNLQVQKIPLPPLPEQRRIAAILGEQMAAVDRARAALGQQLRAAQQLPAAYLLEVFESEEARGWEIKKIGDVCRRRQEIIHPNDGTKGKLRFVGLEHIESHTGKRIGEYLLDAETLDGRKPRFCKGDVLYGYLRPILNKVWMAEFDGVSSVDQYAFYVDPTQAISQYITYYMRSPVYLQRAPIGYTPGYLPRIRSEEVESVQIPLPSTEDQYKICIELDSKLRMAQTIRSSLEDQLDHINQLPATLLRRAFNGEL